MNEEKMFAAFAMAAHNFGIDRDTAIAMCGWAAGMAGCSDSESERLAEAFLESYWACERAEEKQIETFEADKAFRTD